MDAELLSDQVRTLISRAARPLSAKEISDGIECDNQYQLRSILFRLRQRGEVKATLNGDSLLYEPLPEGEEPTVVGLTTPIKNAYLKKPNGTNGHKNGSAKSELLSIIEAMAENPILVRLVRLYGAL